MVIVVFRGQKNWQGGMDVCAASLRRGLGGHDPTIWTDQLLLLMDGLVRGADAGDASAASQLENQLLYAQQAAHQNPYVSCTHEWSIAESFALMGNTRGYVLHLEVDEHAGLDFEELRLRYGCFGDTVGHLREFGVPRRIEPPHVLRRVDLVAPYGQPAQMVYQCA